MGTTLTEQEVMEAAGQIVRAYAAMDAQAYFTAFDPKATFLFHSSPSRLGSRREYEEQWDSWVSGGWKVVSCHSTDPFVQLLGSVAIFSHSVHTVIEEGGVSASTTERETIVFSRTGDAGITAVHEHLSPTLAEGAEQ
ncbi:YybH family protein [Arthrobacter bambusae]|uniref:YybH family protein n=1 Tax=Arthrobacter bambusae TaxID=1338426 RepID=UPI00277FF644|nr:nuclear transport factor 2 family protein [Arthrobacter bambusae]MDQ0030810.1 ketosteroid isomerase-like protein [Arthrobacter bambusae]MDQ0099175.1 ketosteroid isomerase-like protein [Arthrobacter bambusae]